MSYQSQINETGPQRYDEWESCVSHITEIKDGRFVKYDDYTAIAAENAALKAEVARCEYAQRCADDRLDAARWREFMRRDSNKINVGLIDLAIQTPKGNE